MTKRVLVVDDEADVARLLAFNLGEAGFAVESVGTGEDALVAVERERPDAGGEREIGVLMLTARGDEYDRIVGLEVGADDYVVKPFSVREVVLRVGALAKRVGERVVAGAAVPGARPRLRLRELEVDPTTH